MRCGWISQFCKEHKVEKLQSPESPKLRKRGEMLTMESICCAVFRCPRHVQSPRCFVCFVITHLLFLVNVWSEAGLDRAARGAALRAVGLRESSDLRLGESCHIPEHAERVEETAIELQLQHAVKCISISKEEHFETSYNTKVSRQWFCPEVVDNQTKRFF